MKKASVALAGLALLWTVAAHGADGMWAVDADGAWADPGNWTNGVVAGGAGAIAYFTNSTLDRVVTVPTEGVTVGRMEFRSGAGNNNWVFTNGGPVTIDGPLQRLSMARGTQKFYVPVVATNGFQKEPAGSGGTVQFLRTMTSTGRVDALSGWISATPELAQASVAEAQIGRAHV